MNTWYRQHPRYLYTWRSPGDRYRNQIDYITINNRFRNAATRVKTHPGADCGANCDHTPLIAKLKLKLKKLKMPKKKKRKNWRAVKEDNNLKLQFQLEVRNRYSAIQNMDEDDTQTDHSTQIEKDWKTLQEALINTTENIVPMERRRGRQKWMNEQILEKMDERRAWKGVDEDRYKQLDQEI